MRNGYKSVNFDPPLIDLNLDLPAQILRTQTSLTIPSVLRPISTTNLVCFEGCKAVMKYTRNSRRFGEFPIIIRGTLRDDYLALERDKR